MNRRYEPWASGRSPTYSSRLNVVTFDQSRARAAVKRTSSSYSAIGVRPVASPKTRWGFSWRADASRAATTRAAVLASGNTVTLGLRTDSI